MTDTVTIDRDDAFWLLGLAAENRHDLDRQRLERIESQVNMQARTTGRPATDPLALDVFVVWISNATGKAPIAVRADREEAIIIARTYNLAGPDAEALVLGYRFTGLSDAVEIPLSRR